MSIQISVPIKWKSKPNRTIDVLENRKFHEKSKYINDMLTNDEMSFHKKSGYDVDSKTSLHIKSSYKLDIFTE